MSTQAITQRAWVEIHLANLVENARAVQAAAHGAALLPMVKADGYGLGAVRCALALETLDPWGFGVATVSEGAQLRAAGVRRPILVFTPAHPFQRDAFRQFDLRAVIDDPAVARAWDGPFHLEIDTGMSRCGLPWTAPDRIAACGSTHLEGVFTHLHSAEAGPASVAEQWQRFQSAFATLPTRPRMVHVAGSAGVWRLHERLDLVRPGIFLYGGRHAADLAPPRPVAALRAPIVSIRVVPRGGTVSYGATWTAQQDTTVATLAIGYADGVPRAVENHAMVLLGGTRCAVVGRVTMDFVMVDAGRATSVAVGDIATLIGEDGRATIGLEEFAGWAGTIAYEVLARLGARLERRYLG